MNSSWSAWRQADELETFKLPEFELIYEHLQKVTISLFFYLQSEKLHDIWEIGVSDKL